MEISKGMDKLWRNVSLISGGGKKINKMTLLSGSSFFRAD